MSLLWEETDASLDEGNEEVKDDLRLLMEGELLFSCTGATPAPGPFECFFRFALR